MDVVTYALAKKMASSVASGITEIETNGTTIRFKTTSGDWFTVTLNSINEVSVSANGHLIVKLSDGTQIDCGALPVGTMDSSLSTTSENGVQNKVITNALNGKQNTLIQGSGITIDTTDPSHPQISANIDYTNLINKPTKLSDFTNDKNFITNTANNLSNYYLKTETYTQSEVNDLVSQLASLSIDIVETLPTTDISTTTIYLINASGTNNYNQWMYINNAWANIGSTSVDLTNYYTKTQTDTLLADKVDKVSGKGLSTNDFTNAYKSILDNYTVDSALDSTSTNPIQNAVVTQALDAKQPKTLSSPITIGGTSQTTVEGALGGLNSLCGTKLTMVTSLPLSPSNQETVLYIGNSSGGLLCGGIYQYQVSEWVLISIDTSIIPSNASASNKLVTHQVPYELFTLNNNSGSQKWYKLGKYEEGNYTARLDFVSARVDGQMFESSVRISGVGTDNNYVSWVGEKGYEISIIAVKVDSARNIYIKMNSYSAVEIRVYGTFTLDIVEQSSEPSGVQIVPNVLATMDKVKDGYVRILKNNDTNTKEAMLIAYKAFDSFGLRIYKEDNSEHELRFNESGISYLKDGVTIWTK